MTAENEFSCGDYPCLGKVTGICSYGEQIRHQKLFGSPLGTNLWKRRDWRSYIKNTKKINENCALREQLEIAQKLNPEFKSPDRFSHE